jgi:tetratricopeptide (TPR) repeat protein
LLISLVTTGTAWGSDKASEVEEIQLNKDGVAALARCEWHTSLDKFREALRLNPASETARNNLSIAHNNYALRLFLGFHKTDEALREFRQAIFLDPTNPTTRQNYHGALRKLGKDPESYTTRVELGNEAESKNDLVGAVVEYREAIRLKGDPELKKKLDLLDNRLQKESSQIIDNYGENDSIR